LPRKLSRAIRLLIGAGVTALAIGAAPAVASACDFPTTTKAFAPFGDTSDYFLAAGGDFESLTWQASGVASLVNENEPFGLAPGVRSLRLEKDASVTSPPICVSRATPHLRFVAKSTGSGQLDVEVRVWENGKVTDSSSGSISPSDHRVWAPSRNVDLKTGDWGWGQTATVTVRFKSQGTWQVDNVFIDPYRR
jgi:hypothetical protein